ncbi:hypothetical protein SGUI_1219 [Serinicoccus hydrothermalis]|uniref:YbjN domain-containing protein n=1 Tax=Serinicoccus hydrothermalis TaxID=1758689 RepID=A0A1B1NB63_9MICO|nr:hypothetical protein [Serinicoccus hydrothermalis]ANS78615.1 hypothetical protein SGUI_1219 [Serinicoccus hydrothermalis]
MSDPTSLPNFPPPPQEHPLTGRVLDALQDLQMSPNLDKAGDVSFEVQNQKLFVKVIEGEQFDIMRVFGQWQIASSVPEDLLTRLNGCNDVTLGVNLVKAGIASGNLVLAVEQIIARAEKPKPKIQIATGLLLQALQLWHRNVVAKSQAEQGLEPELPEGAPEGTEVGPWLSVGPQGRSGDQGSSGGESTGEGDPQDQS